VKTIYRVELFGLLGQNVVIHQVTPFGVDENTQGDHDMLAGTFGMNHLEALLDQMRAMYAELMPISGQVIIWRQISVQEKQL
jgi:hypothetical protein